MEAEKQEWQKSAEQKASEIVETLKKLNEDERWIANGDKPCKMFKMEIENRLASKGESVVDFPFEEVIKFFLNPESSKKINEMMVKIEILFEKKDQEETSDNAYKVYLLEYKGAMMVSNREFVVVNKHKLEGENGKRIYYIANSSIECPLDKGKNPKAVRGTVFIGGYILEELEGNKTKVTYLTDQDPAGSIPQMLKNQVSVKQGGVAGRIQAIMEKEGCYKKA